MSIEELIHPDDTKALKVLMNIPALPQVMEKVFEYGYDEISGLKTSQQIFVCQKHKCQRYTIVCRLFVNDWEYQCLNCIYK